MVNLDNMTSHLLIIPKHCHVMAYFITKYVINYVYVIFYWTLSYRVGSAQDVTVANALAVQFMAWILGWVPAWRQPSLGVWLLVV